MAILKMQNKMLAFTLLLLMGGSIHLEAMHELFFRLGDSLYSWIYKDKKEGKITANRFTISIDAFEEFAPRSRGDRCDAQEFDKTCTSYSTADVGEHCSRLAFMQLFLFPMSNKNRVLLHFARIMQVQEKEWTSWHTELLPKENSKKLEPHMFTLPINENSEQLLVPQDYKSPYYRFGSVTQSMYETLGKWEIVARTFMNVHENIAYHDELKFLETQRHKMRLYWHMKPNEEKQQVPQKDSYKKTYNLLKDEIALFKADSTRTAFTRSCMRTNDFQNIQAMRKAYTESQQKGDREL